MTDHTPPPFAPLGEQDLKNRFTYHAPAGDRVRHHQLVREACHQTAKVLVELCPPGRELSLAVTHLEEVAFWANAAIARQSD